MESINKYLELYAEQGADALHIEPNKAPYVTGANGEVNLSPVPLQGGQINGMIFGLIPEDVKRILPNSSQVSFSFPHRAGVFDFSIKKTPAGFNVTVTRGSAPSTNAPVETLPASPVKEIPAPAAEPMVLRPNSYVEPAAEYTLQPDEPQGFEEIAAKSYSNETEGNQDLQSNVQEFEVEILSKEKASEPPPTTNQEISFTPPAAAPPVVAPSFEVPIITESANPAAKAKMDKLFYAMAELGASDLHMSVSVPPMMRKDGKMVVLSDSADILDAETMRTLLTSIMPANNQEEFAEKHDTDFAYEIPNLARFRANIFMDRKGMGGVFRIIPSEILTAEDLSLSKHILDLCALSKGLVVVTGPTGSGKSTTLCAMVDYINRNRDDHIITIEDPIEFVHDNKQCLVNQREVHNHTDSFKNALRAALREDPDILLVGEMRDLETISIAIETAETGHLVFGTLHTTTAASTVDRIIDQFPADRQQQIRVMLSESLRGVIAQTLLPKKGGGRIAALEVLIVTPAISNLIREGKTFQIPSAMQTGKTNGMVMLNDALVDLCKKGIVEPRDAYIKAVDKTGFEMLLERNGMRV
ncbi:MAG: type IV pilus twitching motility protein PilT [Pyrinomonadaceae bacterium]